MRALELLKFMVGDAGNGRILPLPFVKQDDLPVILDLLIRPVVRLLLQGNLSQIIIDHPEEATVDYHLGTMQVQGR